MPAMAARGAFSSNVGFILAGAGSAIGLGAIWRFPYMTGANGGAVFVLVFLACCFLIGVPVMIAEITLGRHTERNPVGTFNLLHGGWPWKAVGALCVLSGFMIFSWYSVIAGWILGYLWHATAGTFATAHTAEEVGAFFASFVANPLIVINLHLGIIAITAFISPYTQDRGRIRALLGHGQFIEIFVDCPIEECEKRDKKGIYAKARAGMIKNFTGISAPYEAPENPDLVILSHQEDAMESALRVMDLLRQKRIILE